MMNKGQIWIETVLYTLIGLALIGIVLVIITPKITEIKERAVIEQTIQLMSALDDKILEVMDGGAGNRRLVEFTMKRGELYINSSADKIIFVIRDLEKPYSEPGVFINITGIEIFSAEGDKSNISMTLNYLNLANLSYDGDNASLKKFNPASMPYKFYIENLREENGLWVIDIKEGS